MLQRADPSYRVRIRSEKSATLHISHEFEATLPYSFIMLEKGAFGLADLLGNDDARLRGTTFP